MGAKPITLAVTRCKAVTMSIRRGVEDDSNTVDVNREAKEKRSRGTKLCSGSHKFAIRSTVLVTSSSLIRKAL